MKSRYKPPKQSAAVRNVQRNVASLTIDIITISSMLALHREFGFGAERLNRFLSVLHKSIETESESFGGDLLECLKIRLRNEAGIEFESK